MCCSCLNNLIHEAASISLKLKARNTSKKRTFKHKKWFDFTLKEIKASLIVCSKKLAFKPYDKELRQRCFCLHRKYIKAKRAKRRNYFSNIMKQLESISSNFQNVLWELINKLKDEGMDNSDGLIESST